MILQTVDRALVLLEWVATHPKDARVREAADALDLNITTCYHLVSTLLARGFFRKDDEGFLRLGSAFFQLWPAFLGQSPPDTLLVPIVTELVESTRESGFLNIWDGEDAVNVFTLEGPQMLRVAGIAPGHRSPSHSGSPGKIVLAYLPETDLERYLATHELSALTENTITDPGALRAEIAQIAVEGIAFDMEETFPGVVGMSVPFFGPADDLVGTVGIAMPPQRFHASEDQFRKALLAAGERASRLLGYSGPYPAPRETGRARSSNGGSRVRAVTAIDTG